MYIILGKNGYIAEAITKELTSRDLPHWALSRSKVDYTNMKIFDNWLSNTVYKKQSNIIMFLSSIARDILVNQMWMLAS